MLRYLNYLNNSKYSQNLANLFHIVFFILDHLSIEHWMLALVKTCQNPEEEVIRMHSACWSQWVRCSNSAAQDVVHFFPYRFVLRMLPEISPAQGKWHQVTERSWPLGLCEIEPEWFGRISTFRLMAALPGRSQRTLGESKVCLQTGLRREALRLRQLDFVMTWRWTASSCAMNAHECTISKTFVLWHVLKRHKSREFKGASLLVVRTWKKSLPWNDWRTEAVLLHCCKMRLN